MDEYLKLILSSLPRMEWAFWMNIFIVRIVDVCIPGVLPPGYCAAGVVLLVAAETIASLQLTLTRLNPLSPALSIFEGPARLNLGTSDRQVKSVSVAVEIRVLHRYYIV